MRTSQKGAKGSFRAAYRQALTTARRACRRPGGATCRSGRCHRQLPCRRGRLSGGGGGGSWHRRSASAGAWTYGGSVSEPCICPPGPAPNGRTPWRWPGGEWKSDGRPQFLRDQVRQALRRPRMERIDLLQLHRIDPGTPLADQLGTPREVQTEGLVGRIGLSEVTVDELEPVRELVDVVRVQNRCHLLDREHEAVPDACAAAGGAFLPWRPVTCGNPEGRSRERRRRGRARGRAHAGRAGPTPRPRSGRPAHPGHGPDRAPGGRTSPRPT
ncbi:aldo/keto reductase [Streptomyces sp. Ag82_G6-1]|uniref:aldo/keto reductase n=1 Tax=Streptomyces sp. Ag82_G6-1 TaxID=1938853 RepID=UPI00359C3A87